jgi:hypothetical protein
MPEVPQGKAIAPDQAWRLFADWQAGRKEIGIFFHSQSGSFSTLATLRSARNGTVEFGGDAGKASLRLKDAQFTYGPMMTWPRWPNPPIVEIIALQANMPNGTWIIMAEGLRPEAISSMMLPGS